MLYIHQPYCISPQHTFGDINLEILNDVVDKKMLVIEPGYEGIPPGILRRMGKAIRIGVGAAMPIIKNTEVINGIIIGTANGGMGDCIMFLNQIVQYEEGLLAPGNFVQSTSNAIAAQLGLLSHNTSYNITHVHRGLAFENAVIDAMMQLAERPGNNYLVGGVEEISSYNYNIQKLSGAYKEDDISITKLYETDTQGSVAGEGAATFLMNTKKENAAARLDGIRILHTEDEQLLKAQLKEFISKHLPAGQTIDLLLTGESGDNRILHFYTSCESLFSDSTIARYKHLCGEYPTTTAVGLWCACRVLETQTLPIHMLKKRGPQTSYQNILLYNNYRGVQHSFILISK
ncbi:MAG TPA: beta-ketoacyl synthase chain length factor [Ferruginibacter sp.]|jgi:hypothetical protein|nr:beta-ketoacyl synthase chain length factor [Ferruginibacter sp.]